jgi:histidine triad (HIT) family protein
VSASETCVFCQIRDRAVAAHLVLDESLTLAFLDQRPVFPGHVLVIPRHHYPTLADLPAELVGPVFEAARRVAAAVQSATGADGSFLGLNNIVSQSVPHLHVHVVPRRRKDGLRGFFWPRQRYESDDEMASIASRIQAALQG